MNNWIEGLHNKFVTLASHKKHEEVLNKTAAREDLSAASLRNLLSHGYDLVTWDSSGSRHSACIELNNQKWTLEDFLSGLRFDAPIAERSHPNDTGCTLVVSGEGLPTVSVDYNGNVSQI